MGFRVEGLGFGVWGLGFGVSQIVGSPYEMDPSKVLQISQAPKGPCKLASKHTRLSHSCPEEPGTLKIYSLNLNA